MPFRRDSAAAARLLVTLCVVARCGAGPLSSDAMLEEGLNLLHLWIDRSARLAAESTLAEARALAESVRSELRAAAVPPARDCSDLPAGAASGVHLVSPGLDRLVPAYCDMDTDGGNWTVIQRRADVQPRQDFYLGWQDYKWGLGQLDAEFWWGNQRLWLLTSLLDRQYELRIDLEDFDGEKRYALYQDFRISPEEDGYRLHAANYTGDAGDSLGYHSGQKFSTKDKDNDISSDHCATDRKGAWWYKSCHHTNLNGPYLSGPTSVSEYGVNWKAWRGYHYSLKRAEMKIRPTMKLEFA